MSEGLRAEDVKEALESAWWYEHRHGPKGRVVDAAARDHLVCLASQEQTPDYTPEQIRQDVVASTCESIPDQVGGMEEVVEAQFRVREYALDYADALDAALVGFHPQDKGDER